MNRFEQRSKLTELIDQPGIPFADWAACLKELNTINSLLGGHKITTNGVKALMPAGSEPITIAEIGCGGGDNLKAIETWNKGRRRISYTGIDLNPACIEFARQQYPGLPGLDLICADYKLAVFNNKKPDIIFSSLFCHHFSNDDLIEMLRWLKLNAGIGFFINDLQRHPLAFHSIKWLTGIFSRSYLIKNDAPVSVLRGFRKTEWKALMRIAGIKHYSIRWQWAFRYLIIVRNE